jgi:coenzyme F420-dependent glucose-6-phosphate dehydrogenase
MTSLHAPSFPGRFWLAIGSGEALNEIITGDAWPATHSASPARTQQGRSVRR